MKETSYTTRTSSNVVSNLIISGFDTIPHDVMNEDDEMLNTLKQFWETETIGIKESTTDLQPTSASEFTKPEISHNGRYYEVGLPWKDNCMPTSDNYGLSVSRLRSLHYNLRKKPALLNEYDGIIQEQCKAGIVERVPDEAPKDNEIQGIHFSPHHAVVRKDRETTKVRVVYDGSAKTIKNERSLNDCLDNGPNYIPLIFDMLIKFRSNRVALTADIEKAFLMVGIKKEHRDMLRFLWFANPIDAQPEIVQYRFNRLVFGLRPSPSILGATIKHHLELYRRSEPELVELIEKSLYVDDLVSGELNEDRVYEIYEKSKKMMAEGGFNLRKWKTNSRELRERITQAENVNQHAQSVQQSVGSMQEDDESYAKSTTGTISSASKESVVKVLGLNWNTISDEFYFEYGELYDYAIKLPLSKRSVLKVTAKIFDPIGILSPFTIGMKILFQELCVKKLHWDGELHPDSHKVWKSYLSQIKHLSNIHIPRCYFSSLPSKIEFHAFSDASKLAYAAVVYVRTCYENGLIDVRLVASKSRVAISTVPRQFPA